MDKYEVSGRFAGRPDIISSKEEADCYKLLEKLEIPFEYVPYPVPPQTPEQALQLAEAIGVKPIKNLVFSTRNRKKIFLLILPTACRFDLKKFRNDFQVSKLHLLDDGMLSEILHTRKGAVSVFELQYDTENRLELFIDERVLEEPYFRMHPDTDTITLRIHERSDGKAAARTPSSGSHSFQGIFPAACHGMVE